MTSYLTAAGVQQFSITIASGSLTGTATITAVGSGAFIIYQGINPSESTSQLDDSYAWLTLTNSTTVTATRGVTGSAKTVVIKGVVVDGDTTNLIKSVQFGTAVILVTTSSATTSVSAVTNANTAIAYLGQSAAASETSTADSKATVSLSGTTVTAAIDSSSLTDTNITVAFCVIEFQGSALNSNVQKVSVVQTPSSGTSATTTITSVNTANTMLIYGGFTGNASPSGIFQYSTLTNATTVTTHWNTNAGDFLTTNLSVVEFVSGVLAQGAQRGTITITSGASNTATITSSALASTLVNWLGNSTANTASAHLNELAITQTNATTLTMTATAGGTATGTGSYEVIQFTTSGGGGFTVINRRTLGYRIGSRSNY